MQRLGTVLQFYIPFLTPKNYKKTHSCHSCSSMASEVRAAAAEALGRLRFEAAAPTLSLGLKAGGFEKIADGKSGIVSNPTVRDGGHVHSGGSGLLWCPGCNA